MRRPSQRLYGLKAADNAPGHRAVPAGFRVHRGVFDDKIICPSCTLAGYHL